MTHSAENDARLRESISRLERDPAEIDATLTEAEREGLIEAVQAGNEVEYVEALIADRLTRVIPPEVGDPR